jgi:hypothetical protein
MQYMNRTNTQYFLGDIDFMQTAGVTSANYTHNLKVHYAVVILTFTYAIIPRSVSSNAWENTLAW